MKRLLLYLFLFCFANAVFAQQEVTIHLEQAGTLAEKLGDDKDKITTLHVSGPLDEDDFKTLKSMNMLQVLDMGEVSDLPYTRWYKEDYESGVEYKSIPNSAFQEKLTLREVVLPESLELIGSNAFSGCANISRIDFSNAKHLTVIENSAFYECYSLNNIDLSEKAELKEIEGSVFNGCNNLKTVDLSGCNKLETINRSAFSGCDELININLSDCISIKSIGESAFYSTNISEFNFSTLNKLESLGNDCFYDTPLSGELKFPTSLKTIGERAFKRTNIEKANFEGCVNLSVLPTDVFYYCKNLQEVNFNGCTSLNTLSTDAFRGCSSLNNITIDNDFYKSIEGVLTDKTGKLLLYPMGKKNTEYRIPNNIVSIASGAFNTINNTLQKITIPSSVKQIEPLAFCSNDPFEEHATYYGAIILESSTPIGLSESIGLENAIIFVPKGSAKEYRNYNIWKDYNIVESDSDPVDVTLAEAGSLSNVLSDKNPIDITDLTISGPMNSEDFEFIRTNMIFINKVDISEAELENNELPENAFYIGYPGERNSYLETVVLPNNLKIIGEDAFRFSHNLKEINLPNTIEEIRYGAFYQCYSLENISFKELKNLRRISDSAFEGCEFNTHIEFPSSIEELGYNAFSSAKPLSIKFRSNKFIYNNNSFENADKETCIIYVPKNLLEEYKNDSFWGQFENIEGFGNIVSVPYNEEYGNIMGEGNYEEGETVILKAECRESDFDRDKKYIYFFSGWFDRDNKLLSNKSEYSFEIGNEDIDISAKFIRVLLSIEGYLDFGYYNIELLEKDINYAKIKLIEPETTGYSYFYGWIKDDKVISKEKVLEITDIDEDCHIYAKYIQKFLGIDGYKEIDDINKVDDVDLILLSSSRLYVTGDKKWQLDRFSYEHGASLLNESPITANNINYIVNSYDNWQFISLPYDIKLSEIKYDENYPDAQFVVRYYDGATRASNGMGSSWKQLSGDDVLKANQGYIFRSNSYYSGFSFDTKTGMDAMFNKENVTINLQTHASSSPLNANWNLVGNPYPCYYSIKQLFDNGFDSPIIVWSNDIMNYEYYTADDEDAYISPLTSFFVQKNSKDLVFTADGRAAKLPDENFGYLRSETDSDSERVVINLALGNDSMSDKTRVVLNPQASMEYEIGKDATKFESMNPNSPSIFSLDKDNNQLAINERPYDNGVVRIGCKIGVEGNYSISLQKAVNKPIMLHDLETGNICDLSKNAYEFESSTGVFLNRFELRTDIPTSNEMLPEGMSISMNGNNLSVNGVKANSIIILVDASGKMIYNSKSTGNRVEIRLPMEGVYYLQIVDNMGQKHVQSIKY